MLDAIRAALLTAHDVRIAVAFTRCSGLGLIFDDLRSVIKRGGSVRLLTSTYQSVTQPEALESLLRLEGAQARLQSGRQAFHAKFWWFSSSEHAELWAGSSNLTKGGIATNIEWNIRRTDSESISLSRRQFDDVWARSDVQPLSNELILEYRLRYRATMPAPAFVLERSSIEHDDRIKPNAAQSIALARLQDLRGRGIRRAAIIAATGIGKTFLAAFDVKASGARSVLYVSHRLEHLHQARAAFAKVLEGLSLGILGGGEREERKDCVFASIASIRGTSILDQRQFEYVVIDEFHHVEAPSYGVLNRLREHSFVLGLTATPERQDGHDVLSWCDWNVAYEVRLPEAIDRGWLLPFHYYGVADETIDFASVPWRNLNAGDQEDVLSIAARVDLVLRSAVEKGFDGSKRAAIAFCAGKRRATFMSDEFRKRGEHTELVLGDMPVASRREIYARLEDPSDPLEWIFVSDVLNEGVDIPAVNVVLFLRPTDSATVFLQQLGRGLRLHPGVEVLTVLDFVAHDRSAWLTINALDSPSSGGARTEIVPGQTIRLPRACELVLDVKTKEILSRVRRFTGGKKEACTEAYARVRAELGRPVLPVDLWSRADCPDVVAFRQSFGKWIDCQRLQRDMPEWASDRPPSPLVHAFLGAVEANWQAPRVTPYALLWAVCAHPYDVQRGYSEFFRRWPQWSIERVTGDQSSAWAKLQRKLGAALVGKSLHGEVRATLGGALLAEVEGRLLYTLNQDYADRHGGMLKRPEDLNLWARYRRPEIIRHFGLNYDPAKHNVGMIWVENHGVVITKLDTEGAVARHQYENEILSERTFAWTSQNRMSASNAAGAKLVRHLDWGAKVHLFVQSRSHMPALYLGPVSVASASGPGPMAVVFELEHAIPASVVAELSAGA